MSEREASQATMAIEVRRAAPEEASIVANLFELYAHDFSEFSDVPIGADGRFGNESLSSYWREANRFPFLVRADGNLAGFVLVQQGSRVCGAAETWDVAEFFVLRRYRRHSVGRTAAHEVWRLFPGDWEVRVAPSNIVARTFWRRAVSDFTGMRAESATAEIAGKTWDVFSFSSVVPTQ